MKTVSRIETVKRTISFISLSLEVVNYATQGELARSMMRRAHPDDLQYKRPAKITYVQSERLD